jgi:hypothetical protein
MSDAVIALRDFNIYSKLIYCNPCAGATTLSVSIPLKHPQNTASLVVGSPLVNAQGVKGDGVGTYINTLMNIDPNIPSLYDVHSACYQNLSTGFNPANGNGRTFGGYSIGQNSGGDGSWLGVFCFNGSEISGFIDAPYNTTPLTRQNYLFTSPNNYSGFLVANRTAANRAVFAKNGSVLVTNTNNLLTRVPNLSYTMTVSGRTNLWRRPFFWGGNNNPSNGFWDSGLNSQLDTRYVSSGRFAWLSNGLGLTDTDLTNYNTVIQTLQTAWGRNL